MSELDGIVFRPEQVVDTKALMDAYARISDKTIGLGEERADERPVNDPFGFKAAASGKTPPRTDEEILRAELECVDRMVRFLGLVGSEFRLTPRGIIFITELFALNTYGADDSPLSQAEILEARKAAFAYYKANADGR